MHLPDKQSLVLILGVTLQSQVAQSFSCLKQLVLVIPDTFGSEQLLECACNFFSKYNVCIPSLPAFYNEFLNFSMERLDIEHPHAHPLNFIINILLYLLIVYPCFQASVNPSIHFIFWYILK